MAFVKYIRGTIQRVFKKMQVCPFCDLEAPLGVKRCPRCGHEFSPKKEEARH